MTVEFEYDALPGRVVFASGALARIADEVDRLGVERVLLVAGHGRMDAHGEQVRTVLGHRCVGWFDEIRVHVPVTLAHKGVAAARSAAADALVCVGGGSATGMAKAIARELALPIVAVPTTYSGSEMTPIWGTTSGRRKQTGQDRVVLPRTVIYDPELTLSMPPGVTGPSGMNALAHCIEALYAPHANPVTSTLAEEGIRALAGGLPEVVAHGDDAEARAAVLYGAYLAGATLAVAGTSVHHKIAHILGGTWDLPHGPLHAILLPHTVAFVVPAVPDAIAAAARALGTTDVPGTLFDLLLTLGIPPRLTAIGMPAEAFDQAVDTIVERRPVSPLPVEPGPVAALLRSAFDGVRPKGAGTPATWDRTAPPTD